MTNKKVPTLIAVLAISVTLISSFVILKPFQKDFPSVSLFGSCSADNISGAVKVESKWVTRSGTELIVQGWAADSEKTTVASQVSVQLVDSQNNLVGTWVSKYDTDRADVASVFNNSALNRSGMNINIGSIEQPGNYKIQLGSVNDSQFQICILPILVQVNE